MKESIEGTMKNLKDSRELSGVLVDISLEVARACYKKLVDLLDNHLYKVREKELKSEHIRERWISTPMGDVRIRRRQYLDKEGKSHYLLDELLGLKKRSPFTRELKETAIFLSTLLPFMKSSQVLEKSLPQAAISHTTIHRLVKRVAEPYLREEEVERKQLYETGEIPRGEDRVVSRLFLEADGTMIALQREKEKKAEVKVGIAYEGWEEVSKERYRVTEKTSCSGVMTEDNFWENFSLKLARKYDLAEIKATVIGGDGASWVKDGVDLLGGSFQLDRFHLLRALRQALVYQKDLIYPIYKACVQGNWPEAEALLTQSHIKARGKEKEKIGKLISYLRNNKEGLKDYRIDLGEEGKGLRGMGAIESNVDKLVANRMKKRGMSWTIAGARRMTCLLVLSMENRLVEIINKADKLEEKAKVSLKKVRRILKKSLSEVEGKWLKAGIPALYGPHQGRPWVRFLKSLSEVSLSV